jgi:hypothetical protein
MMSPFGLNVGSVWPYAPHNIITNLRVANKSSLYIHHNNPELENVSKQRHVERCIVDDADRR